MVQDAQSHSEEDKKRREESEVRNRADALVYTTEKTLAESKEKLSAADVEEAGRAIEATRQALKEGGRERIEAAVAELTKASHRLAETLYKQAGGPGGAAPGAGPSAGGDGDVVDAEVVDDKK